MGCGGWKSVPSCTGLTLIAESPLEDGLGCMGSQLVALQAQPQECIVWTLWTTVAHARQVMAP